MMIGRFNNSVLEYFENANVDLELQTLREVLAMYMEDIPEDQMGAFVKGISSKGEKGLNKFIASVRKSSIFTDKSRFEAFAKAPTEKALLADPLYNLIVRICTIKSLSGTYCGTQPGANRSA